jgi:DNA-binding LacI/PurR family transcriptional regulator
MVSSNSEKKISASLKSFISNAPRKSLSRALEEGLIAAFSEAGMQKNDILPSNAALAKSVGISHITLRKALKSLEEEGVVKQVHGKGTYLNRDFSGQKKLSGTVAVFLPHVDDLYAGIVDAIGKTLTGAGLKMRIESVSWQHSSSAECDHLPVFEIDDLIGIIRSPSIYPPALIREVEYYRKINAGSVPVVMIDRPLEIEGISSVGFDDVKGVAMMFDYLWDLDFRNIYFVYPNMINQNMRNSERSEGFKQAAEKHNYNYENKFLAAQMPEDNCFEEFLSRLLKQNDDDLAFLCNNDSVAKAINDSVAKLNIKNRRVKVAGFDRSETTLAYDYPFPSVFRSRQLLGSTAAKLLIKQIKNQNRGKAVAGINLVLDPELIQGVSHEEV